MEKDIYESKLAKIKYLEKHGWREYKQFGGWAKINWTQSKDSPPLPLEVAFIIEYEYKNQETFKGLKKDFN